MDKYYFGTIRKIVSAFGTIFADIHIDKHHEDNTTTDVRVPLNYGSRQAWYLKLKEKMRDAEGAAKIARTLPRISFEMKDLAFANDRKTTTTNRRINSPSNNPLTDKIYHQYAPIPYDFLFTVSIAVKNIEDGLRIMEQIIPLFRPDHTLVIEELPALNIKENITVNMDGIQSSDENEGLLSNIDRVLTWDINFTVNGHIFPPITDANLITNINIAVDDFNDKINDEIVVTTTGDVTDWKSQVKINSPNS